MTSTIVMIVLIAVLGGGTWLPALGSPPGLGGKAALPVPEVYAGSSGQQGAAPEPLQGLGETQAAESFAGAPGRRSRPPGAAREELGPVYMYGELLEKPYVFTNVGEDTLYLNWVPYWPIRKPHISPKPMTEEQLRRLKELREGSETHAFADSVWKVVKAMHDSGASYEECLGAYAEMYRNSPRVRSVSEDENGITITWADGRETMKIIGFEPSPPLPTKEEIHKGEMEDFWRNVRSGRMVARGFSQGQTYSFTAPGPDLERMNRLIERLAAGDTLSEESMIGTPFMYHPRFRMDVARRAAQRKAREE